MDDRNHLSLVDGTIDSADKPSVAFPRESLKLALPSGSGELVRRQRRL